MNVVIRLLPPESAFSDVDFEAELRVEASDGHAAVAFMSISRLGQLLKIGPDHVSITRGRHEVKHSADMTRFRKVALRHRRGWLQVQIDGASVLHTCVFREETPRQSDFPWWRSHAAHAIWAMGRFRTQLLAMCISYRLGQSQARGLCLALGRLRFRRAIPDQYQRERIIQIHGNHPDQKPWPDHGYSSWIQRQDGSIYLVDYTNAGDVADTAHLVGVNIVPDDIA